MAATQGIRDLTMLESAIERHYSGIVFACSPSMPDIAISFVLVDSIHNPTGSGF
jgi:hypothetical protein